jgi:hypothetical protein
MKLNRDSCKIYRTIDHLRMQEEALRTVQETMEFSKITSYFLKHRQTQECLRLFIIVSNQLEVDLIHQVAKWDKCHTLMEGINTLVAAAVALKELSKE